MPRNRQPRVPLRPDDGPERITGGDDPGEWGSCIHARTSFTDWLAAEGAPWRPFDDTGELVQRQAPRPRVRPSRAELFDKDCERQLIRHLKTVCLWPARDRDKTWRLGDYSHYELQFEVPGRAVLTVQFHSEPDERTGNGAVSFGVSSRRSRRAGAAVLDAARQDMLRDHGFVVAMRGGDGNGGQFRKQVLVPGGRAVRALARETIAILCKVLDYDGTTPLEYRMHLGTRLSAGFAFDGICAPDLLKLMHRWGFAAVELEERANQAPLIKSMVGEQPFLVAFVGAREEQGATAAGEYGMIGLRTFMRFAGGVPDDLPNAINTNFATVKACIDEDGDLVVQMPLILHGGVTAANLEMCFRVWRETLEEIGEGLE
jgi:Putative bacterial sensory transduction regulator